jgi:release factor glutamine methyltransferase
MIKWGADYLKNKGFDEARLNIELLLSATLGLKRFDLYVRHDQPLKKEELERFKILLKRRLTHEPIQYILGLTNFYSIEMKVDRRALIPRPETETLVETVIEHCRTYLSEKNELYILDIGTGSGCIDVALAKFIKNSRVTSIDKSKEALGLASENAGITQTEKQIQFIELDFLTLKENSFGKKFDIIVSNPPYVSGLAFKDLAEDIKGFEPFEALSNGADGLAFFKRISESVHLLLNSGGWVFVETSFDQARDVERIFLEGGASSVQTKKDLSNIDRVVSARF